VALASIIILAGILLFIVGRSDISVEREQKKDGEEKEE
jgi:hypothetical protein